MNTQVVKIMTNRLEQLVVAYEVGVEDPEVGGMEHLDMLLTRSQLARLVEQLSPLQKARLAKADQTLTRQADKFYKSIARIADLKHWREQENAPASHWWWYLDVLAEVQLQLAA